jgi:hypothetical protein
MVEIKYTTVAHPAPSLYTDYISHFVKRRRRKRQKRRKEFSIQRK